MNIKFSYLYRDYSNYKKFSEVVFANPNGISIEEVNAIIKNHLIEDMWFNSTEWDVPDLHFDDWNPEDDHALHEFESIEETEELSNDGVTIDSFLDRVNKSKNAFI